MNNFEDVYSLNRDERQISNLETYRRFISKGDKPLQCINDEDAKAIKDALNGKGKILAVVDGRRSMAGNHKYVLFVKEEGGVKVYLFTVLNGLYNEMGPYKDLDTAMSNADCYGLFEECKQVANKKVLNEDIESEEEFEDWDSEGFDDVCEGDMEDFSWDAEADIPYDERNGYKTPSQENNDYLADCFPICDPEEQTLDAEPDEGLMGKFFGKGSEYHQIGDNPKYDTPEYKMAMGLYSGDNAPAFDMIRKVGKPLGSDYRSAEDVHFANDDFINDADLDAWAEGKANKARSE